MHKCDSNGHGLCRWPDGSQYEGEWKNDQRVGKGKYRYDNGDVYEGDWFDDERNGYGTYTFADGDIYRGEWIVSYSKIICNYFTYLFALHFFCF